MFFDSGLFLKNQQIVIYNFSKTSVDAMTTTLVLKSVLKDLQFKLLKLFAFTMMDVTMVDTLDRRLRFSLLHNFFHLQNKSRIFFEKNLRLMETAHTASKVFASANCAEREVYDLFGTFFIGHNDLRRILTDYSFLGYPLRKDFPLTGFLELNYSLIHKSIISKPVQLSQELRQMDYLLSWRLVK